MNKTELVESVATAADLSKAAAGRAVDAVIDNIIAALQEHGSVSIVGFGKFSIKERSARTGHNPQTGEKIQIKAAKLPVFKAGKALRDAVAENN